MRSSSRAVFPPSIVSWTASRATFLFLSLSSLPGSVNSFCPRKQEESKLKFPQLVIMMELDDELSVNLRLHLCPGQLRPSV